jgi:hypothetical protein
MLKKNKPWRSKKYREWIKSLPCCVSGQPADDAHHITHTGQGGMGTKPGDNYCIPLTRELHTLLHADPKGWETTYGKQADHLEKILQLAVKEKMLSSGDAWITGIEDV